MLKFLITFVLKLTNNLSQKTGKWQHDPNSLDASEVTFMLAAFLSEAEKKFHSMPFTLR